MCFSLVPTWFLFPFRDACLHAPCFPATCSPLPAGAFAPPALLTPHSQPHLSAWEGRLAGPPLAHMPNQPAPLESDAQNASLHAGFAHLPPSCRLCPLCTAGRRLAPTPPLFTHLFMAPLTLEELMLKTVTSTLWAATAAAQIHSGSGKGLERRAWCQPTNDDMRRNESMGKADGGGGSSACMPGSAHSGHISLRHGTWHRRGPLRAPCLRIAGREEMG